MLQHIVDFFKHILSDAKGRPEIKMILGIPTFIVAIVYVLVTKELAVAGFIAGNAITLMGFTAAADAGIDRGNRP